LKKLQFIINPIAGKGLAPRITALVEKSGLQNIYDITIHLTEYPQHATQLAAKAVQDKCDVVVAVGGDGTVNEVAAALNGSDTALGIIPAGSGNGFARHIGMKLQPTAALEQLKKSTLKAVDTIFINGIFSLNVSGFGFDGYVAWLFNKSNKRGLSNYTKIALKEYYRYPTVDFELMIDGKKITTNAHMLVISNASQFGNKAIIAPMADISDGKLDLAIVKRPAIGAMIPMFIRLFTGTLKNGKNIKYYHCSSFTAKAARPIHLHIDGEANEPIETIEVKISPSSLKVVVPQ
jgi:YegS/Rv2252/BmrU family lipid kinase